ncbi:MAG: AMP-binding protein [Clostridia bacterium]|nr:AMP-binding protein [Clostridia bacterium]
MAFKNRKKNYPLYETTKFGDFREMTENVAKRYPEKIAFQYKLEPKDKETKKVTFAEAREFIKNLTTELHSMNIEGKRVAILGQASVEWFFSYVALMSAGAVTVPVDKDLPVSDIASILNTSGCSYAFFSNKISDKIEEVKAEVSTLENLISMGDEDVPFAKNLLTLVDAGKAKADAGDTSYFDYKIDSEKLSTIVFTSGTTGKGKGVMLSLKNICSDMEQGMYNFNITERTLFALPPHHTFGSTVNFIGHFAQGCEIYISSGIRYILDELKLFKPTHLILVPLFVETFYKRIMATAEKTGKLDTLKKGIKISNLLRKLGIDLRKKLFGESVLSNFGGELQMIICGGAALNQNIIDFFESIGVVILNGYGITECAPLISCNRNECRKQGSVGMPIIGGEVKIANPNEAGEGEICYRGPNVMLGYFGDEEATRAVIDDDGFFHTGDLGYVRVIDGDQWIYITGRSKNLIIFSNGKNVYPEEIETDIQGIYGVNEVVVYAGESKSDPSKEVIVAEIYPDFDALKLHSIDDAEKYFEDEIKKINARNVSYKTVGKLKIRNEEFPKNTSRKITRFKIDKTID